MYYLYKYECDGMEQIEENNWYEIKSVHPTLWNLKIPYEKFNLKKALLCAYFHIITLGHFYIYYVISDNQIIHTSFVLGKCYKFPFMKKGEYEIGPCITEREYRGKGIYPSVIKKIIADNTEKGKVFYMFCNEKNLSSIKGILKAGFREDGILEKSFLKRYVRK